MTLHVDPVEAFWFAVNAVTLIFTIVALVDARRDQIVARGDSEATGDARRLTANGNVRREVLRTSVQLLLISIVIPGLFIDRPATLSPALVALILVPVVLLVATVLDWRDRGRLADMLLTAVRSERSALALESSVQAVKELTQAGIAKSEEAIEIGNHSREALLRLTAIVGGKEDKA